MKQKLPDKCDMCGKEITSETQYTSQWFQGKSTFSSPRIRAKKTMDTCHPCFLEICKIGYKPEWIKEIKNPQYKKGSTVPEEKPYYIEVIEPDPQTKIEA